MRCHWARSSGQKVDHRIDSAKQAAKVIALQFELGMGGDKRENVQLADFALRTWGIASPPADAPRIVQRTFVFGVLAFIWPETTLTVLVMMASAVLTLLRLWHGL